ncbi:hypothetical protein EDD29_3256 [Actinocorallia herbida]|uniref:Serine esterase DUF676 n=1 Tax=Actinocorallia herbida TaxID=58109 RepID=A0A3N1CY96_9ACTN|nr:hypothetical protein [Actinocorallia herbida]ROO85708.1 hypothetical protein EDD29_3256 [Actinocorallia herbida]
MSEQEQIEQAIASITIGSGVNAPLAEEVEPVPFDEEWDDLPFGFARVYYGGDDREIKRPVIISDGFELKATDLDKLYRGLNEPVPFLTRLRERGNTVILLGYRNRTASLFDNAQAAEEAIRRTHAATGGAEPLTVGGFSMGGLITRYALTKLDHQDEPHNTKVYFSYDTPHRGGVVPVALQAFAHFLGVPLLNPLLQMIDSPAAKQMLWRYYDLATGESATAHPDRDAFLASLEGLGGWPRTPELRVGVANGAADGTGAAAEPGDLALRFTGPTFPNTSFYNQAQGQDVVAELHRAWPFTSDKIIITEGFPEVDGAPGGTLSTYQIVANALGSTEGVQLKVPDVCFVPTVSAVALRDLDDQDELYAPVDPEDPDSELDEYLCSSTTTPHTAVTEELVDWLLARIT